VIAARITGKLIGFAALFWAIMHFAIGVVAGFARCPIEGCLPW
jgi:hypothetical protein